MQKIALVGTPNSGKSSLFNLLTGLNQEVGNYSGSTVEKKSGIFEGVQIVDLPGIKNLFANSLDEKVSQTEILKFATSGEPIIMVANAMQLERSLLLFTQLADLQIPLALVVNFKDDLERLNLKLDVDKIEQRLKTKVILMNSKSGEGVDELRTLIQQNKFEVPTAFYRSLYEAEKNGQFINSYQAVLAANDNLEQFEKDYTNRQQLVDGIVAEALPKQAKESAFLKQTTSIDKYLLHPFGGILFFLFVMFLVFQTVFSVATYPMDWIDGAFASLSSFVSNTVSPEWLADLLSNGVLPGIGGVVIFIPQIALLFFLLGILEHTGYLARISFISDNFLQKFGLSGNSVIPLMSGWACSIPAIMSARTLDSEKERLAVILATPLMTCSARLPVYAILVALIFPNEYYGWINLQGLAMFALYLLGVIATLLVAWGLNKIIKSTFRPLWTLDLPVYRFPNWRNVLYSVYNKTKSFVVEAGKVIFVISIVLWFLASFSPHSSEFIQEKYENHPQSETLDLSAVELEYSYAGYLGKVIEPVIKPLGYDWKIGIALLTSFAAREVFVGTLSTIYSIGSEEEDTIIGRLKNEKNPITGNARFNVATSVSLLLFYVFALQCMSTMAVVRKETGSWKYPIYQFVFMLVLAYVTALIAYQIL